MAKTISVRIPEDLYLMVREKAHTERKTKVGVIADALNAYLDAVPVPKNGNEPGGKAKQDEKLQERENGK